MALLLGIVGIYGVVAYIAAQRTREVGIRMALGAGQGDVSRLFVRHGLALTGVGLLVGAGAAAALTRLMATMLFGIGPTDPVTYVAASCALGGVAAAGDLPAGAAGGAGGSGRGAPVGCVARNWPPPADSAGAPIRTGGPRWGRGERPSRRASGRRRARPLRRSRSRSRTTTTASRPATGSACVRAGQSNCRR